MRGPFLVWDISPIWVPRAHRLFRILVRACVKRRWPPPLHLGGRCASGLAVRAAPRAVPAGPGAAAAVLDARGPCGGQDRAAVARPRAVSPENPGRAFANWCAAFLSGVRC